MSDDVQHGKDQLDPRRWISDVKGKSLPEISDLIERLEEEIAIGEQSLEEMDSQSDPLRSQLAQKREMLGALLLFRDVMGDSKGK